MVIGHKVKQQLNSRIWAAAPWLAALAAFAVAAAACGGGPPPELSAALSQSQIDEGEMATLTITASAALDEALEVSLSASGVAFAGGATSLTIPAGQSRASIALTAPTISSDSGGGMDATVMLSVADGAAMLSPSVLNLRVNNPVEFSVSALEAESDGNGQRVMLQVDASRVVDEDVEVVVDVPSAVFGVSEATITIPAGRRSGTMVLAVEDTASSDSEIQINLSSASGAPSFQLPSMPTTFMLSEPSESDGDGDGGDGDGDPSPPRSDCRVGYEGYDYDLDTAIPLTLGEAVEGRIDDVCALDAFSITLTESSLLKVSTTGPTDTAGGLINYKEEGLTSDDNEGEGKNFAFWDAVPAGTYYVVVGYSPDALSPLRTGAGDYTLVAELLPPDDHANSFDDATPLALNEAVSGSVDSPIDSDYFRITVDAPGVLAVRTMGATRVFGELYDDDRALLAHDNRSGGQGPDGRGQDFAIWQSVSAGTYYVAVRPISSHLGDYTLHAELQPPNDHGSGFDEATPLNLNEPVSGSIQHPWDKDYFIITIDAAGVLALMTTGPTDTFGILELEAGGWLASSEVGGDGQNFAIWRNVPAGAYHVLVGHVDNYGVGDYTLHAELLPPDDHGDGASEATPLALNESVSGSIQHWRDRDYFRIAVDAPGVLTVRTMGTTDTYGALFDSDGNGPIASDDGLTNVPRDGDGQNFAIMRSVTAGTYYAAVSHPSSDGTGDYTLHAELLSPDALGRP